jgi:hypothetical protein
MNEIFKNINLKKYGYEDYTGLYKVSNYGCVKRLKRIYLKNKNNQFGCNNYGEQKINEKILTPQTIKNYFIIGLTKNKKRKYFLIHRLVAMIFICNLQNKSEVNHIDGNKKNNNINNLEWVTKSENRKHAFKIGLINQNGENNPSHKLTNNNVIEIKKIFKNNIKLNFTKIAKIYNVKRETIRDIYYNKIWKHIIV